MLADVDPVVFANARHLRKGGFAGSFKVVIPNAGNGEIVIIPEFAFFFGTVAAKGGVAGVDRIGLAIFVKEVGEADFVEDVVFFEIFFKIFFVLDNSVFEGDTIWAN